MPFKITAEEKQLILKRRTSIRSTKKLAGLEDLDIDDIVEILVKKIDVAHKESGEKWNRKGFERALEKLLEEYAEALYF